MCASFSLTSKVWGVGFRVKGFRVLGLQGLQGSGFRVQGLGPRGFRVYSFQGSGFRFEGQGMYMLSGLRTLDQAWAHPKT